MCGGPRTALCRAAGRALRSRLPVLDWLPSYSKADALGDAIAGVTVGLTLIPQSIAYASLAGLPPQYGLYSALAGGPVYLLLGTSSEVSIQLTALVALLTAAYTQGTSPDLAVLLCFLSGCVQLACGLLRLGFLVDFVSVPVVQGFTAAAVVTIASSQMKGLLGLSFSAHGFVDTWRQLWRLAPHARGPDTALALFCVALLLALRWLRTRGGGGGGGGWRARALWLLATSRNALVVLGSAGAAAVLHARGLCPFLLSGAVEAGLPEVRPPPFETHWDNRTAGFTDMLQQLGPGIAVVPVVSILGNVAVAKAFARGRVVDASQEMLALGACNLAASFFRSAPLSASFTCSAVNKASGVRTPAGSLCTAALVALALAFLTQYFAFIPRAALAAVVLSAVLFMADVRALVPMWRGSRWDLLPLTATFTASLALGVATGLLVGVACDLALLLYSTARPSVATRTVPWEGGGCYLLVTPAAGLAFPCADHVRESVVRALAAATAAAAGAGPSRRSAGAGAVAALEAAAADLGAGAAAEAAARPVAAVLDLAHVPKADFSSALGLAALAAELRAAGEPPLLLLRARPRVLQAVAAAAAPAAAPPAAASLAELAPLLSGLTGGGGLEASKL